MVETFLFYVLAIVGSVVFAAVLMGLCARPRDYGPGYEDPTK